MANMSYCRFENTFRDLNDCYLALIENNIEGLSETEQYYAKKLIELSTEISKDFDVNRED